MTWLHLIVLSLASWRIWHLLADDEILDRPRRYITGLGWNWRDGDPIPDGYRERLRDFIECPYCMGAWVSLVVYLFWEWLPTQTLWVCVLLSLNAVMIAFQKYVGWEE